MNSLHQRNAAMTLMSNITNSMRYTNFEDKVIVSWNYEAIQNRLLTLTNLGLIFWLIREVRRG